MGINEEEMARRMEIARMEMEEGQRRGAYDHILMNIEPTDACVAPHPHPARARARRWLARSKAMCRHVNCPSRYDKLKGHLSEVYAFIKPAGGAD